MAPVCPDPPIRRLNPDFSDSENVTDAAAGYSRSFDVSADGNRVYWAGYTNSAVFYYQKPDALSPYDSMGVAVPGVASESLTINRDTGELWLSSGSPNDPPNNYPGVTTSWVSNTWYAFHPDNFTPDETDVPTASAFFTWQADGGQGRPRGLAFSGNTATVTQFLQPAPAMQQFRGPITRFVAPNGSDAGNDCTDVLNPCATITHAVDEALDGDIINLEAGTYTEPGLLIEKILIIQGEGVVIQ